MAVASATKDPRFYPMKEEDLHDFPLEISVLSPTDKNSLFDGASIGKMGLCVKGKGPARYGGKGLLY